MADISITINDAEVRALLQRAPQALDTAIVGALNDASTFVLAQMQRYPPARPGSTYRRTRTLGRSWSRRPIQRTADGWQAIVGSSANIAPYNRYVQDRTRQARIHQGRWLTAEDAIEHSQSQVQRFVDARVRAALGGL